MALLIGNVDQEVDEIERIGPARKEHETMIGNDVEGDAQDSASQS